jgi:hypothetical protein
MRQQLSIHATQPHPASTHACCAQILTALQVACNLAGLTHPSLAPSPVPGSLQPKTSNQCAVSTVQQCQLHGSQ